MFCPKCGGQNPETGKYCRACGTDLGNITGALATQPRRSRPISGKGKPIEQQARDIAQRLDRYRPMAIETVPERRLMQEIMNSGLPIGQRRISKILRKQIGVLVAQPSPRDET